MNDFDGKVAFVTGGGTGIGRATALRLADRGCRVVVAGRREGPLAETASRMPDRISHVTLDLGNWAAQSKVLESVHERHGRLDILVNNAATQTTATFLDHTEEQIARNIHVNLTSTAILIRKALPRLIEARGTIVNVTSAAARYCGTPGSGVPAYAASKAGLNHLTRVLASELGVHGIRVNAVAPGLTDTEIAAAAFENAAIARACADITPLRRNGTPDDVAKAICWIASDEAGWITGQVLDATGGFWLSA
ncbi:MAG TPA: SDR family oxidoreductase [Nevskiaceae bacterium]|nr:SDR family oxidoreductase [Nevskiaceae bacterium]